MKRTIKGVVASLVATIVLSMMPLSVLAAGDMEINSTNFGSDTFADYLISIEKSTSGCNGDGKFSSDELGLIKSLKPDSSVTRIIGLKAFPNLTTLDVSACTSLTSIIANDTTSLTTLKLGSITNLEYLYAKNTAISSVDVTKCTKLKRIYLSNAPITSIDLSKNRALAEVLLDGTSITSLDISACPNIYNLDISNTGNAIESLDIANNYLLIRSGVGGTKTTKGNIVSYERTPNGEKRFLRVDKGTEVYCSIDEKSVPDEAFRNIVKKFDLDDDDKFSMDELKEVKVISFNSKYNVESVEGLELFYNLETLGLYDTAISSLDLKNNPSLINLTVWGNYSLKTVDLSKTPNIQKLYLFLYGSEGVDLSPLKKLVTLWMECVEEDLDLSGYPELEDLVLSGKNLKTVNLSGNPELTKIQIDDTSLSSIDLSNNTKLIHVELNSNLLSELDLTNNPEVSWLDLSRSKVFPKLIVNKDNKIKTFYCYESDLTELDLSSLNVTSLSCHDNNLSTLDLSNQTNLCDLNCGNNNFTVLDLTGTKLASKVDVINFSGDYKGYYDEYYNEYYRLHCDKDVELLGLEKLPTATPTPTATPKPTTVPTAVPTTVPTKAPTATPVPTKVPGATSAPKPTTAPGSGSGSGSATPTKAPGATSAPKPTSAPGAKPTSAPAKPTSSPSGSGSAPADNGVGGFIDRLYTVALDRDFDEGGKNYWTNEIKVNGQTGADIARQFLYSEEFLGKNMSQDDFLTVLYRTFFDREPDEGGLKYWKDQMSAGQTKEWVIAGFINSEEWANICLSFGIRSGSSVAPTITITPNENVIGFATRLYTTCLKRDFDPEGLDFWAKELANLRRTGSEAAKGFFFSDEINKSGISDSEFLTRLYKTLMNREPEKEGFDYWLGQMKSGAMSRESVFDGFAASEEWVGICADYGILR